MNFQEIKVNTDVLIVGGGTAGCYCARTIGKQSKLSVIVAEKSFIKRSGCLAAGVNALNAFIGPNETEDDYLDYIKEEFDHIVREDLVYSIAKRLNKTAYDLEAMGLPILKNSDGSYHMRGKRSVKINGENIKPILARSVKVHKNIQVIEKIYIADLIRVNGRIIGAIGFSTNQKTVYTIYARAVICTAGGASGIYKSNHSGDSKHKMWYSPFNCGSGYALGIRIGAEMTTFEMRFIALRCKDTIAPTGTIAQSLKTDQVNSLGKPYMKKYIKPTTITRLYATQVEYKEGRGPCYLVTKGINEDTQQELYKAYLNMAPSQTLKWFDQNQEPSTHNVEIAGTEPYIVGGHTASGYWVDTYRRTTIDGLYAAGDVCGGSPKKYVTGCLAEAEIVAETVMKDLEASKTEDMNEMEGKRQKGITAMEASIKRLKGQININEMSLKNMDNLENKMQVIMDQYAGGISTHYEYNENDLLIAASEIDALLREAINIKVRNTKELTSLYEVIDRLYVAKIVIAHLQERKETRWPCYQSNQDYPNKNTQFDHYINSIYQDDKIHTVKRSIVTKEEIYEHTN